MYPLIGSEHCMLNSLQKIDIKILDYIDRYLRCSLLDKIMPIITDLGNGGIVWIILSIYLAQSKYFRIEGYMVITSLILTTIIGEGIIKHLIRRTRPYSRMSQNKLLITRPITYSFPSGHAASSFAVAGIFIMMNSNISIFITVLASLIAFSRLYLNVHYISDVLFGVILGIMCSIVVVSIFSSGFKGYILHFSKIIY